MKQTLTLLIIFHSFIASAQFSWNQLPANLYPDTLHYPFILGVASNEPTNTEVSIWTYAWPDDQNQGNRTINWEMADDKNFSNIIQSGTMQTDTFHGYTAQTRINGLSHDTYYWYRFNDGQGNYSVTGRTRTLPVNTGDVRFAVASCSGVYSGYFHAYEHIAKRNDLNAVIHLGDFHYDYMDLEEQVRVPDPFPLDIYCDITDRHRRLFYYMLDEDMRHVRQQHPFIQLWDNHDVEQSASLVDREPCIQAFRDFTAMPVFDTTDIRKIYRKISLGPLVDLFMIDITFQKDRDSIGPGENSYLGKEQYNWLTTELQNSTARWKLVGNQKMFTHFSIDGFQSLLGVNGSVLTGNAWDGHQLERKNLLSFIDDNNIDNVMILSGDMHFALVSDLPVDPLDTAGVYDPATGEGSVAVEFLPTGVTSGNFDEQGFSPSLNGLLVTVTQSLNPYHRYSDFIDNGYGILVINPDSIVAQVWFNDIKIDTDHKWLASELILRNGDNHWSESQRITEIDNHIYTGSNTVKIYPNPATEEITVEFESHAGIHTTIEIWDLQGRLIETREINTNPGINSTVFDLKNVAQGNYLVKLSSAKGTAFNQFVKQ